MRSIQIGNEKVYLKFEKTSEDSKTVSILFTNNKISTNSEFNVDELKVALRFITESDESSEQELEEPCRQ